MIVDIHLLSKDLILQSLYHSTSLNIQLIRLCLYRLLLFDSHLDLIQLSYYCYYYLHLLHYSSNKGIFEESELSGLLLENVVPYLTHPLMHTAARVYQSL